MTMKWIGALLIMLGCGGFGFSLAATYRQEEKALKELITALQYISCELQYRVSPLPQLCRSAAERCGGCIRQVLERLAQELEAQVSPDAGACMYAALSKQRSLPEKAGDCLLQFGSSLGNFDLPGQIRGIEAVERSAELELDMLRSNRELRCRSYRTLGLCAGSALVVLFL